MTESTGRGLTYAAMDPASAAVQAGPGESAIIVPVDVPIAVRRLRDRMDPWAAAGVPAHVTLLYPFMAPDALDEQVRAAIQRIVGAEPSFAFALTGVGRWTEVVYLTPDPEEPFRRLIEALTAAFPAHPPHGGVHAELVPHLTVAQDPRPDYLAAAEHALPAMLPFREVAREVWVIGHRQGGPWTAVWRLPFAPSAERRTER